MIEKNVTIIIDCLLKYLFVRYYLLYYAKHRMENRSFFFKKKIKFLSSLYYNKYGEVNIIRIDFLRFNTNRIDYTNENYIYYILY